ncbi:MAG: 5-(carboxyamino)imidazole ribonucleotide mutase [Dictyoglomi bacterium]|nr:5-(carboxyamino)imidazole ribonucleotide mutase [Dictyoglomota bacterium]
MFVSIIMGSTSDFDVVRPAVLLLKEFGVEVDVKVLSAHRTPKELVDYVESVSDKVDVFITAAGLAAALPGVVAAHTLKPVIGLPVKAGALQGVDALLSIVQMPPGVPVATVGIGRAKNAALLAIEIMALKYPELEEKLREYRQSQREKVLNAEVNL